MISVLVCCILDVKKIHKLRELGVFGRTLAVTGNLEEQSNLRKQRLGICFIK